MNKYDVNQTWQWNLQHAPALPNAAATTAEPCLPGDWSWCGQPVNSPLGVPAGPLLDARWLLFYAHHGFDILVYKTVRSVATDCYPLPNLLPVNTAPLNTAGDVVPAAESMKGSWAVSFGMPSQSPDLWRADVALARDRLPTGKVLVVSVVGTVKVNVTDSEAALDALADDFALCAAWAMNSGAHGIEANFSCPNVSTADGQLYQQPQAAGVVAERIRSRIGSMPLVLKIGRVNTVDEVTRLLHHVRPHINGLAMTNSIAAKVSDANGTMLFHGQPRGICGDAIRAASVSQVELFRNVLRESGATLDLIGVGGISTAEHVVEYLTAGATSVAAATAVMTNPDVGLAIRERFCDIYSL
ncbi:MAG: hypothetical protein R3C59_12085 [Planctomycetaceae bacterium]